jgi:endonuclease YncB( thermonuclease family)
MIVYAITAGRHHRRGRGLLHGIDAPEVDQTFWWRSQRAARLSLAEALIAGVKVRGEVVERHRHGRLVAKVFSPDGVEVGRGLVLAGWAL